MEDDVIDQKFYALGYTDRGQLFSVDSTTEDYTNVSFVEDTVAQFPGGPASWSRYIQRQIIAQIDNLTSVSRLCKKVRHGYRQGKKEKI